MEAQVVVVTAARKQRHGITRVIAETGFPPDRMIEEILWSAGLDPRRPIYSMHVGKDTLYSHSNDALYAAVERQ